ncbi:MAG: putative Membrane Spanning Protein [bacterium]|nr:MAG: putative Membrane Spanning Protein [bacterium]
MLYYAFFFWCKPKPSIETNTAVFSYHKNNEYIAVFIGLLTLFIGESFAAHYFLATIDNTIAWIATLGSIYTILWIWGDFQAIRLNPITINNKELKLNSGKRWQVVIARETIDEIIDINKVEHLTNRKDYLDMTVAGEPSLIITLKESIKVKGLFGITRKCKYIGIYVDDLIAFKQTL